MENRELTITQYLSTISQNTKPVTLEMPQEIYNVVTYKSYENPYEYISFKKELAHKLKQIKNSLKDEKIEETKTHLK